MIKPVMIVATALALGGCVAEGPLTVAPGQGKSFADLQRDDAACRVAPAPATGTAATGAPNYYQCMAGRGELVVAERPVPYPVYAAAPYPYAGYGYPYGYGYGYPYYGYGYPYSAAYVGLGLGFGYGGYYGGRYYHGGGGFRGGYGGGGYRGGGSHGGGHR